MGFGGSIGSAKDVSERKKHQEGAYAMVASEANQPSKALCDFCDPQESPFEWGTVIILVE